MTQLPPHQPVAITGIGVVGATGRGLNAMDTALREGREGVGKLTLWESELADFPVGQYRGDIERDLDDVKGLTDRARRRLSRSDMLAILAVDEAVRQAGLTAATLNDAKAGAYVGESVCGTLSSEAIYIEARQHAPKGIHSRLKVGGMFSHEGANTLDRLAELYRLPGPTLALMTACSSAANAIGLAADQIRLGRAGVMLAGGADSLSRIAFNGFCSLKVVSEDGPRPFDRGRTGMMVGEGAGVLVLESLDHAKRRGAKVLALLTGYGHSCDAHHLTAPHPEGRGAITAMRQALETAGVEPGEVGYVNAHGTATRDNDTTEALAIRSVFGDGAVPVSSTKRSFGHTLAAAGGVEAVVSVWALMNDLLPMNLGLRGDPEDTRIDVLHENTPATPRHVLSNSFGFGGNNAALVFSRAEP